MTSNPLVWLITGTLLVLPSVEKMTRSISTAGCSSGFGRRLAASALERGDRVIATARSVNKIQIAATPNLRTLPLDLTAGFDAIKQQVDEAAAIWGRIDVLCNNAGDKTFIYKR